MTCCSHTCDIAEQFDPKTARKDLRRCRRKGPDQTTRMLIESVRARVARSGSTELTLLDVGGGIGAIHHELVNGAVRDAVHVDVSPAYLAAAREETTRRGQGDRVQFVLGDLVEVGGQVEPADIVTLDRVICCYPDMNRLV